MVSSTAKEEDNSFAFSTATFLSTEVGAINSYLLNPSEMSRG